MKHLLTLYLISILFVACSKETPIGNQPDLKERFNGKYAMESCVAEEALDLDMNQVKSKDLLLENKNIAGAKLELRILEGDQHLFTEAWPVEYISLTRGSVFDSTRFDPSYSIGYALYGYGTFVMFSSDFNSITLLPRSFNDEVNTLVNIESVFFKVNERVEVTEVRRFFTFNGWKTTRIVSVYKRYTKVT
jgi:hypothetical protein